MNIKLQQRTVLPIIIFMSMFSALIIVLPSRDSTALNAPANQAESYSRCTPVIIRTSGPEVTCEFEKTQELTRFFIVALMQKPLRISKMQSWLTGSSLSGQPDIYSVYALTNALAGNEPLT